MDALAALTTDEQVRTSLRAGLTDLDLQLGAFDAPTLGTCLERVVDAAMEDRAHAGSAPTRRALAASVRDYLQAKQWVAVHRSAGAAPCMPSARWR